MKTKVLWTVLSCIMVVALVLTSCGPAAEEGEKEVVKGKVTKETVVVKEEEKKKEEEVVAKPTGPQYGGTLTMAFKVGAPGWDLARLHPYINWWNGFSYEAPYMADIERLGPRGEDKLGCSFNRIYEKPEYSLTGALAESWEVTDPTTITWHVRKGVHFHNKAPAYGRELDAYDFEVCLERLRQTPRFSAGEF